MLQHLPRLRTTAGLGALLLVITACGGGTSLAPKPAPTATLTPTPAPQAKLSVVTKSKSGVDASALDISVSASCPAGTIMVGGGYHLQLANNQQLIYIRGDYPSAANAWTVSEVNAQSGGAVTLTAEALCLTTNLAVTTSVVSASSTGATGSATCPAGTTLVGGGFDQPTLIGSGWILASHPSGSAWQVAGPGTSGYKYNIYAVCASNALTPKAIQTATASIANNATGEADASCAAGQMLVGGGYSVSKGGVYVSEDNRPSTSFGQWRVHALNLYIPPAVGGGGGPPPPPPPMQVVAYGVCVTPA